MWVGYWCLLAWNLSIIKLIIGKGSIAIFYFTIVGKVLLRVAITTTEPKVRSLINENWFGVAT